MLVHVIESSLQFAMLQSNEFGFSVMSSRRQASAEASHVRLAAPEQGAGVYKVRRGSNCRVTTSVQHTLPIQVDRTWCSVKPSISPRSQILSSLAKKISSKSCTITHITVHSCNGAACFGVRRGARPILVLSRAGGEGGDGERRSMEPTERCDACQ